MNRLGDVFDLHPETMQLGGRMISQAPSTKPAAMPCGQMARSPTMGMRSRIGQSRTARPLALLKREVGLRSYDGSVAYPPYY
ncbi:MAG: hypothetical protein M3O70_19060 [Actinomycetota bacterium]|nr:hypothetical protein [Actinomycetota bacterium]